MKKSLVFLLVIVIFAVCAFADVPIKAAGLDGNEILSHVLQQTLDYLIPILAVAFLGWLGTLIKKAVALLKEKVSPDVYDLLSKVAISAVEAAEQLFEKGENQAKLVYAQDYVQRWLENYGITLDLDYIRGAVEAAVNEMKSANWMIDNFTETSE